MRRVLILCAAALSWSSSALAGEDESTPVPTTIEPALTAHISSTGFEALGDAISGVLPTGIAATGLSGEFDCDEEDPGLLLYSAEDIQIHLSTDSVVFTPTDGHLDVAVDMTLWSDDSLITLDGSCVLELDESCNLALPPTWLSIDLGIDLLLEDGGIQAQVDSVAFTHGNFGNPIDTGCILGDALETMQGYGVDVLGEVLDDVLESQLGELETQLEDAIAGLTGGLTLSDELELLGTTIGYDVVATDLELSNTGLLLTFSSTFIAESYGDCVPQGGSYLSSSHDMPLVTGLLPETSVPYHFGLVVNEDMLNQAFHALWQGGLLCLDVATISSIDLNTDYLALVDEELVASLWPEPKDLDARLLAEGPPRIDFASGLHFDLELAIDVYGDELHRDTRFWSNGVYADGALDLDLEDGELDVVLDFDLEANIGVTVAYNEWLPMEIAEGFGALLPGLVGAALDIEDLTPSITIPTLYGITLSDIDMRVIGNEDDYLGVYAWIDPATATPLAIGPIDLAGVGCGDTDGGGDIVVPGCDGDEGGGCGEEELGCAGDSEGGCGGCEGEDGGDCADSGCTLGLRGLRLNAWSVLFLCLPAFLARRRRS